MTTHELTSKMHKYYVEPHASFGTNVAIMKAYMTTHRLFFKEKHEIRDSEYWTTNDVEDYFFDLIFPGETLPLHRFEYVCERYFDFKKWEQKEGKEMWDNASPADKWPWDIENPMRAILFGKNAA